MKEIWLNIQCQEDRDKIILVFANSGYFVKVKKEKQNGKINNIFWVIFEISEMNIKEK